MQGSSSITMLFVFTVRTYDVGKAQKIIIPELGFGPLGQVIPATNPIKAACRE